MFAHSLASAPGPVKRICFTLTAILLFWEAAKPGVDLAKIKVALTFLIAFVVCGVCSVPWPGSWSDRVPGTATGEIWQTLWLFDHAEKAAFRGDPLLEARDVNPPGNIGLYPGLSLLYPMLFAPVTAALGLNVSVNMAAWLALFLSFICAYLFLWEISGDYWPGVLGALAYACGAYSIAEVGSGAIFEAATFLVPLAGFFIVRLLDKGGVVYGLLSIGAILAAALHHYTYGVTVLLFAVCASIWAAFDEGFWAMMRGLAACAVSVVLFLPMLGQLDVAPGVPGALRSLDLLEPFRFVGDQPYLFPMIPLVGAVVASFWISSRRAFWWVLAALFFALALGPKLIVWGNPTGIPMAGALVSNTTLLPAIADPFRFVAGLSLALCALFSLGVRQLLERLETAGKDDSLATRGVFLVLCAWAIVVAPGATVMPDTPPVYEQLTRRGAVLELPANPDPSANARALSSQIRHGKPVFCANPFFGRFDVGFEGAPPNRTLQTLARFGSKGGFAPTIDPEDLRRLNIAYVVVARSSLFVGAGKTLSQSLAKALGQPVYTDQTHIAWSTHPPSIVVPAAL